VTFSTENHFHSCYKERESFSFIKIRNKVIDMLAQLKTGEKGIISNISKADALVRRRLLDLGITEGSEVCIKCIMPFGGPYMLEYCGQCVGIRRKEAIQIEVERL
jgi:ferrous iron transport protein A